MSSQPWKALTLVAGHRLPLVDAGAQGEEGGVGQDRRGTHPELLHALEQEVRDAGAFVLVQLGQRHPDVAVVHALHFDHLLDVAAAVAAPSLKDTHYLKRVDHGPKRPVGSPCREYIRTLYYHAR